MGACISKGEKKGKKQEEQEMVAKNSNNKEKDKGTFIFGNPSFCTSES